MIKTSFEKKSLYECAQNIHTIHIQNKMYDLINSDTERRLHYENKQTENTEIMRIEKRLTKNMNMIHLKTNK